jgi:hypothetical protein
VVKNVILHSENSHSNVFVISQRLSRCKTSWFVVPELKRVTNQFVWGSMSVTSGETGGNSLITLIISPEGV